MNFKRAIRYLQNIPHTLADSKTVRKLHDGDYRVEDVPYVCQFPSPELVGDELTGKVAIRNDPNWQSFGFSSVDEVEYWVPRLCGIACVKMLVDYSGKIRQVSDLTHKGVELGGYDTEQDMGWYYKPLVALLGTYDIAAETVPYLSVETIARLVSGDRLVIASVNPQIIRGDTTVTSRQKSGHLVVVVGVRMKNGHIEGFYIHNPSGKTPDMQAYAFIPLHVFSDSFGKRGIVAKVPHG